jgi:hypothetical protein
MKTSSSSSSRYPQVGETAYSQHFRKEKSRFANYHEVLLYSLVFVVKNKKNLFFLLGSDGGRFTQASRNKCAQVPSLPPDRDADRDVLEVLMIIIDAHQRRGASMLGRHDCG